MKKILLALLITICASRLYAQVYPQSSATRTSTPIKIDGVIEDTWKQSQVFTGLIEQRPTPGRVEDTRNRSELYLLYDNEAVYFGGMLYEVSKDSIAQQMGGRDNIGI